MSSPKPTTHTATHSPKVAHDSRDRDTHTSTKSPKGQQEEGPTTTAKSPKPQESSTAKSPKPQESSTVKSPKPKESSTAKSPKSTAKSPKGRSQSREPREAGTKTPKTEAPTSPSKGATQEADPNDIVGILIKDHRDVEKMVGQLKDADPTARSGLLKKLAEAFMAHGEAEETIVYKTMREKMEKLGRFEESYEEHLKADDALLKIIEDTGASDWDAKFAHFVKLFKEHMTQEEETIIKYMSENMKLPERIQLGKRFKAAKDRRINAGEVGKASHIKSHIQRGEKRSPAAGKAAKLRKTA